MHCVVVACSNAQDGPLGCFSQPPLLIAAHEAHAANQSNDTPDSSGPSLETASSPSHMGAFYDAYGNEGQDQHMCTSSLNFGPSSSAGVERQLLGLQQPTVPASLYSQVQPIPHTYGVASPTPHAPSPYYMPMEQPTAAQQQVRRGGLCRLRASGCFKCGLSPTLPPGGVGGGAGSGIGLGKGATGTVLGSRIGHDPVLRASAPCVDCRQALRHCWEGATRAGCRLWTRRAL
jgi:hypothetical protein